MKFIPARGVLRGEMGVLEDLREEGTPGPWSHVGNVIMGGEQGDQVVCIARTEEDAMLIAALFNGFPRINNELRKRW